MTMVRKYTRPTPRHDSIFKHSLTQQSPTHPPSPPRHPSPLHVRDGDLLDLRQHARTKQDIVRTGMCEALQQLVVRRGRFEADSRRRLREPRVRPSETRTEARRGGKSSEKFYRCHVGLVYQ